jgi:hypothetical protein
MNKGPTTYHFMACCPHCSGYQPGQSIHLDLFGMELCQCNKCGEVFPTLPNSINWKMDSGTTMTRAYEKTVEIPEQLKPLAEEVRKGNTEAITRRINFAVAVTSADPLWAFTRRTCNLILIDGPEVALPSGETRRSVAEAVFTDHNERIVYVQHSQMMHPLPRFGLLRH